MRTARTIAAFAAAALALAVLTASPAGGAARRSIAAFAEKEGGGFGIVKGTARALIRLA